MALFLRPFLWAAAVQLHSLRSIEHVDQLNSVHCRWRTYQSPLPQPSVGQFGLIEIGGSRHVMECKVLSSMEVKVVIAWSRNILNSMEFHYITRLTFTKCTPVDIMESSMLLQG